MEKLQDLDTLIAKGNTQKPLLNISFRLINSTIEPNLVQTGIFTYEYAGFRERDDATLYLIPDIGYYVKNVTMNTYEDTVMMEPKNWLEVKLS